MTTYESVTTRLAQQELGDCALIQDLLPLYAENEVSPASRELIAEHVARCERCAGYLAGTQHTLTQLRRDRSAHTSTLARDTPNRHTVADGQRLVTVIALLTTYGGGLLASMLLWHAFGSGDALPELLLGSGLGMSSLLALLALASSRGPLTLARVLTLLGSCGVAACGSSLMLIGDGAPLVGLIVWLLGLGGVWAAVAPAPRPAS